MPAMTIVSNRLPLSVKKINGKLSFSPSIGGLATGLSSYTEDSRNSWIGWPGIPSDELTSQEKRTIANKLKKHNCYPVFLTSEQVDGFYNGYCNSVLWPLFHNLKAQSEKPAWWKAYEEVNEIFADAVQHYASKNSTLWVHDYQLLLLPRLLRQRLPVTKIGFFLHIPFPDSNYFEKLKNGRMLLRGVLGADLIGFHTKSYGKNFLECVEHADAGKISENAVINGRRISQVADFPMGIDYKRFKSLRNSKEVRRNIVKYRKKYGNRRLIFTNDRLDPTKGLPYKIRAFGKLLETHPELRNKVVMAMLVAPSRTDVPAYQKLKEEIEKLIHDINDSMGTKNWTPIDYMFRTMDFTEISALYQIADIAFVTPVRDGMNLVAKEYIASKPDRKGVLILSETAGAAEELEHALLVNPRHHNSLVGALYKGLSMPDVELKARIGSMQSHLSRHNVQNWAKKFVDTLSKPASLPKNAKNKMITKRLNIQAQDSLLASFRSSKKRLLVFDYDGVLSPLAQTPEKAKPSAHLKDILRRLSEITHCDVRIISGRSKEDLDKWLGDLPITLSAEHGAFVKQGKDWKEAALLSRGWKQDVIRTMKRITKKTPGSFIEQKTNAVVWHYRQSPAPLGQTNSLILKQTLRAQLTGTSLGVYTGKMIVEVKSKYINKGTVLGEAIKTKPEFILVIGDDYTDEDMFKAAPRHAYTIKVGIGLSYARWRLKSPKEVLSLLERLLA